MPKEFKSSEDVKVSFVRLTLGITLLLLTLVYIYHAFEFSAKEDCKECEESKKNFRPVPVEVPDNDNSEG